MIVDVILFLAGLTLLYFGAEFLVGGSSSVALRMGVKPLVVGLTVVAFGTSSPELLVCVAAVFTGSDDISLGNIIGSNIANILLILGAASLIRPMEVHAQAVRREFPVMVAAAGLLVLFAYDGQLARWEGIVLLVCMVAYLLFTFYMMRKAGAEDELPEELAEVDVENARPGVDALKIVGGIGGLAFGAHLMVTSATTIASDVCISQLVIGISIVALGTSLPELATSVVAALREESDISVGNVIGSNIFNIFLVIGTVTVMAPITVGRQALDVDLWIMLGVSLGIWPILRSGHRISRLEGVGMLVFYIAYVIYLFVRPGV